MDPTPKFKKTIDTNELSNIIYASKMHLGYQIGYRKRSGLLQRALIDDNNIVYENICGVCYQIDDGNHNCSNDSENSDGFIDITNVTTTDSSESSTEDQTSSDYSSDSDGEHSSHNYDSDYDDESKEDEDYETKNTEKKSAVKTGIFDKFVSKCADFENEDTKKMLPIVYGIIKMCLVESDEYRYKHLVSEFIDIKEHKQFLFDEDYVTNAIIDKYKKDNKDINSDNSIYDRLVHELQKYAFESINYLMPISNEHRITIIKNALLVLSSHDTSSLHIGMFDYDTDNKSMYQKVLKNRRYNGIYRITLKLDDVSFLPYQRNSDIIFEFILYEKIGMVKAIKRAIINRFEDHCKSVKPALSNVYNIQRDPDKRELLLKKLIDKKQVLLKDSKKQADVKQIDDTIRMISKDCILPDEFIMRKIYPTTNATSAEEFIHAHIESVAEEMYPQHVEFKKNINTIIGLTTDDITDSTEIKSTLYERSSETVQYINCVRLIDIIPNEQELDQFIEINSHLLNNPCRLLELASKQYNFDLFGYVHQQIDKKFPLINLICLYNTLKHDFNMRNIVNNITHEQVLLRDEYQTELEKYYTEIEADAIEFNKENIKLQRQKDNILLEKKKLVLEKDQTDEININLYNLLKNLIDEGYVEKHIIVDKMRQFNV